MSEDLSKRDKLAIAGYAAPRLRGARARPIKVVDASGEVTREVSVIELSESVLKRADIEFEVDASRPREKKNCQQCGLPFFIPQRKTIVKGGGGERSARYCKRCRRPPCAVCGLPASVNSDENARRKGTKAYCHVHPRGANRHIKGKVTRSCKACGKACAATSKLFCNDHKRGRRAAWVAKYRGKSGS